MSRGERPSSKEGETDSCPPVVAAAVPVPVARRTADVREIDERNTQPRGIITNAAAVPVTEDKWDDERTRMSDR